MAVSIHAQGSQPLAAPEAFVLASITGPGAFVALVDLQNHNGLEARLMWLNGDPGDDNAVAWSSHITINTSTQDGPFGFFSPPVPIVTNGYLSFEHLAGTAGSPATAPWVVYKL